MDAKGMAKVRAAGDVIAGHLAEIADWSCPLAAASTGKAGQP